ncbi:Cys-tRNA(Pro) deacylase [Clostridium sp. CF011]|uniref:Cys-tRNA(Pro) deacylase n=1 Tax=unclassified Clostridium TaxID=2614128 RepID=UPI001C0D4592|nr:MULTISPECIES: Cys-tRNA(Pro) deacylase [unclassified Clostridium]MBU3092358.1 Cys-tRNA(Pro) deacylase [Clostridium sp. CF011]MBW9145993.1 Cys-tRNA(Pro) deacylase [Clostridium sp. CM027]UVE39464.1 Cys-tRNA(Pro) deacylase [Clostridium sp. CM027]WAG68370.1 Cys-tRNA(Pro) deacylase [Clostridium sp. CF011]
MIKTNAMRILDKGNVEYNVITYDIKDDKIDGVSVANKIGRDEKYVYKTLVTHGISKNIYIILIPVREEIDFKKVAKVTNEKRIEMLDLKDLQKVTGYVRGGCSPIGMKKQYKTFIDKSALEIDTIIVSAGKIGVQVEINANLLKDNVEGEFAFLVK